jgi:hypothetical protein
MQGPCANATLFIWGAQAPNAFGAADSPIDNIFAGRVSRKRVSGPVWASCRDLQASDLCSQTSESRHNHCSCRLSPRRKRMQLPSKFRERLRHLFRSEHCNTSLVAKLSANKAERDVVKVATQTNLHDPEQCHPRLPSPRTRQVLAISRACLSPRLFLVMSS